MTAPPLLERLSSQLGPAPTRKSRIRAAASLLFVYGALFLSFYAFVFTYPVESKSVRIAFILTWLGAILSLTRLLITGPGRVTKESYEESPLLQKSCVRQKDGSLRYCAVDQIYKPDRTHHCSICNVCIPKMDHHCPWLADTCIGFDNYKFFFLFVLYSSIAGVLFFVCVLYGFLFKSIQAPLHLLILWTFLLVLAAVFTTSLLCFLCFHTYILAQNITTIEFSDANSMSRLRADSSLVQFDPQEFTHSFIQGYSDFRSAHLYVNMDPESQETHADDFKKYCTQFIRSMSKELRSVNIFDLGVYHNVAAVFGSGKLFFLWPLPVREYPRRSGYSFPVSQEQLKRAVLLQSRISAVQDLLHVHTST